VIGQVLEGPLGSSTRFYHSELNMTQLAVGADEDVGGVEAFE
jgi:hypothetical protein